MERIFKLTCAVTFLLLAMHGAFVLTSHSMLGMPVHMCHQRAREELFLEPVQYDAVSATSRKQSSVSFGGSHASGLLQAEQSPQLTDQSMPCFSKTKRLS